MNKNKKIFQLKQIITKAGEYADDYMQPQPIKKTQSRLKQIMLRAGLSGTIDKIGQIVLLATIAATLFTTALILYAAFRN